MDNDSDKSHRGRAAALAAFKQVDQARAQNAPGGSGAPGTAKPGDDHASALAALILSDQGELGAAAPTKTTPTTVTPATHQTRQPRTTPVGTAPKATSATAKSKVGKDKDAKSKEPKAKDSKAQADKAKAKANDARRTAKSAAGVPINPAVVAPLQGPPTNAAPNSEPNASRWVGRLLPVAIFILVVGVGVRLGDLVVAVQTGVPPVEFSPSFAATARAQSPTAPVSGDTMAAGDSPLPADVMSNIMTQEQTADGPYDFFNVFDGAPEELQTRLSERRKQLEERELAITEQIALLEAIEKRIEGKIAEMQTIRDEINAGLAEQDRRAGEARNAEINRLVTVYQAMKPTEAARIFDTLDLAVLVRVTEQMPENKFAPILAKMAPERATELTRSLALRGEQSQDPADGTASTIQ